MSTVLVVAPIVVANWGVISAAVTAAVAATGFATIEAATEGRARGRAAAGAPTNREEIEVADSEILADAATTGERIVVERGGVRAEFSRDARGALKVCMEGAGVSKAELRRLGEELVGRVTQQYVYHRLVSELGDRGVAIVDEQVTPDAAVKLRVRAW